MNTKIQSQLNSLLQQNLAAQYQCLPNNSGLDALLKNCQFPISFVKPDDSLDRYKQGMDNLSKKLITNDLQIKTITQEGYQSHFNVPALNFSGNESGIHSPIYNMNFLSPPISSCGANSPHLYHNSPYNLSPLQ